MQKKLKYFIAEKKIIFILFGVQMDSIFGARTVWLEYLVVLEAFLVDNSMK